MFAVLLALGLIVAPQPPKEDELDRAVRKFLQGDDDPVLPKKAVSPKKPPFGKTFDELQAEIDKANEEERQRRNTRILADMRSAGENVRTNGYRNAVRLHDTRPQAVTQMLANWKNARGGERREILRAFDAYGNDAAAAIPVLLDFESSAPASLVEEHLMNGALSTLAKIGPRDKRVIDLIADRIRWRTKFTEWPKENGVFINYPALYALRFVSNEHLYAWRPELFRELARLMRLKRVERPAKTQHDIGRTLIDIVIDRKEYRDVIDALPAQYAELKARLIAKAKERGPGQPSDFPKDWKPKGAAPEKPKNETPKKSNPFECDCSYHTDHTAAASLAAESATPLSYSDC